MNRYRIDFESMSWTAPMEGLRFKACKQGTRQLRLVEYTKDMEPHWCEKGHIGLILQGRFEIKFTDHTEVYNPGDGVFIPSGSEHKHMGIVLTDMVRAVFVEDV